MDEKNFTNWILNNIEFIKKDNNDGLPTESPFGTRKTNATTICTGDDEKRCVKRFINLETRIRTSPKYNLISCLIQKNMSTLLQAIMCLLYDEILFLTNSRSLIYETSNIRLCKKLNEFNSPYKAIQNYNKTIPKDSWRYIAITRNPVDRFISNFIDRCIRKPIKGIKSCNGCNFNMTCFVITEYQYMLKESTTRVMRKEFEDMHFFPQNWRCDFRRLLSNYTIIRYKNKNNNDIEDVVNSLNNIFYQQHVPNTTLSFIKNQLLFSRTMHTTVDTGARKFFENRLINSPFLMEYVIRMYYYDFKLFNYTIPELKF
uniref:Sulfotransfer_1 domain-containing protein n=1 Tax=Strongyloides papillosus TaxID=174720 RepID=A0A0N5BQG2_STREA